MMRFKVVTRSLRSGYRRFELEDLLHLPVCNVRAKTSLQVGEESSTTEDTSKGNSDSGDGTLGVTILVITTGVLDSLGGLGDDVSDLGGVAGDVGGGLGELLVGGGGGNVAQGLEDVLEAAGDGGLDVGPGALGVVNDVVDPGLDVIVVGADVGNVRAGTVEEGLDIIEEALGLRLGLSL
jgi:hypothetical protein